MIRRRVFLLLALWLTALPAAAQTLTPFAAEYRVKMGALSGAMRMQLETVDEGYIARSVLEPKGLASLFARGQVEETSWLHVEDDRVVPRRYTMADTIDKDGENVDMDFDWAALTANGNGDDGDFSHALDRGTYDRNSIQYALMLDLLHGRSATEYTMLDGDRRKALTISHLGDSRIKVPAGEFTVRKVRHQAANSSRVTTLYCAPELGYLPVRIEQHKKDKLVVRAELKKLRTPD